MLEACHTAMITIPELTVPISYSGIAQQNLFPLSALFLHMYAHKFPSSPSRAKHLKSRLGIVPSFHLLEKDSIRSGSQRYPSSVQRGWPVIDRIHHDKTFLYRAVHTTSTIQLTQQLALFCTRTGIPRTKNTNAAASSKPHDTTSKNCESKTYCTQE